MGRSSFVFLIACVAGCGTDEARTEDSSHRCERVRDHLIDLRLAAATNVNVEAHRKAMQGALGEGFMSSCQTMSDVQTRCVLDATDSESAVACSAR